MGSNCGLLETFLGSTGLIKFNFRGFVWKWMESKGITVQIVVYNGGLEIWR